MKIFKVSFSPIMGMDDHGNPTRVGRWSCFVVAEDANSIGSVLESKLPEYASGGFDLVDTFDAGSKRAWSVNVGPEGRAYSVLVIAEDESDAMEVLGAEVVGMRRLEEYVKAGLFRTAEIDLSVEGVW